jgi:hypothetical protein
MQFGTQFVTTSHLNVHLPLLNWAICYYERVLWTVRVKLYQCVFELSEIIDMRTKTKCAPNCKDSGYIPDVLFYGLDYIRRFMLILKYEPNWSVFLNFQITISINASFAPRISSDHLKNNIWLSNKEPKRAIFPLVYNCSII